MEANGQAAKIPGGEISDHICPDCIAILAPILGGDHRRADLRPLLACIEECGGGRAVFLGDTFPDREIALAAGATLIGAAVGCGGAAFTSGEEYPVIASFAELLSDLGRLARPQ